MKILPCADGGCGGWPVVVSFGLLLLAVLGFALAMAWMAVSVYRVALERNVPVMSTPPGAPHAQASAALAHPALAVAIERLTSTLDAQGDEFTAYRTSDHVQTGDLLQFETRLNSIGDDLRARVEMLERDTHPPRRPAQ